MNKYNTVFVNHAVAYPGRSAVILLFDAYLKHEIQFDKLVCSCISSEQTEYCKKLIELSLKRYNDSYRKFRPNSIIVTKYYFEGVLTEFLNKIVYNSDSLHNDIVLGYVDSCNLILPTTNTDSDIILKNIWLDKYDECLKYFPKYDTSEIWKKSVLSTLVDFGIDREYLLVDKIYFNGHKNNIIPDVNLNYIKYISKLDVGSGSKGAFIVDNNKRVLQEYVDIKKEYDIDFRVDKDYSYYSLREEVCMSNGYASVMKLIPECCADEVELEIYTVAKEVVKKINYTGIGSLTLALTKSGSLKIIEFNHRITGSASAYLLQGENILIDKINNSNKILKVYNDNQNYII